MLDKKTPISEYMTEATIQIDVELSLADAKDRMASSSIRHLPVIDDGKLVGMLSARDLLLIESLPGINRDETLVDAAMVDSPKTVAPTASLGEALAVMEDNHIGALPVVEGGKLVGIFTSTDALKLLRRSID